MNLRAIMLCGLGLLGILGLSQGGAALFGTMRLEHNMEAQAELLEAADHARAAELAFERADQAARIAQLAADPATARAMAERFRAEAATLRQALADVVMHDAALQPLVQSAEDWIAHTDMRLPGSRAGEQSSLLREDLLAARRDRLQHDVDATADKKLTAAAHVRAAGATEAKAITFALLGMVGLGLAGTVGIAVVVHRRVLAPLAALSTITAALARGEVDTPVQGTDRTDEIGAVAAALEALRQGTLRARELERATAQDRSAAEKRREARDERTAAFGTMIAGVVQDLGTATRAMRSTADAMDSAVLRARDLTLATAAGAEESSRNLT